MTDERRGYYTDRQVADARTRHTLSTLIARDGVVLKRRGREFIGLCPFHAEKSGSFTVNDEKNFYHCFGCGAHGDALDWRMAYHVETFLEAMAALLGAALPEGKSIGTPVPRPVADDDARRNREHALTIWRGSKDIAGTPGEDYFRHRGIKIPLPQCFRWNPALYHKEAGRALPGIVALVQDPPGDGCAIHRLWFDPLTFGSARVQKTPWNPKKALLGRPQGGAIRLADAGERLGLAEGFENGLVAMQAYETLPVWAAIAAGFLPLVKLPDVVRVPILLADRDRVSWQLGPLYGCRPGEHFARQAAAVFAAEGRFPLIAVPLGDAGDFNDDLLDE